MRHLRLVGVVKPRAKVIKLARRCSWCGRWSSVADYIAAHRHNAKVTHTICGPCERKFMAKLDRMPNPPAA